MIGRTIGNYRIESLLGSGGMGSVYRGLDVMLDRPVAVKALRADVAASPQHVERFRRHAVDRFVERETEGLGECLELRRDPGALHRTDRADQRAAEQWHAQTAT